MPSGNDTPEASSPRAANPLVTVSALVAGLVLFLAYLWSELSLPRGPSEFVFWPPLEPLPFAPMRGFTFEQLARHAGRFVLLGPALILLTVALHRWRRELPGLRAETARRGLVAVCVGALAYCGWLMAGVLEGRPIFDDELTYRMQAMLLGELRLWEDRIPPWAGENFTIWIDRRAAGKYLFGEPLVQLLGSLVGIPALMHLPLAALTLWLWFISVSFQADRMVAAWATLLLAISPMFLLTTATGLSQPTSLACLVVAGWGYCRVQAGRELSGALAVAAAIGFCLTVRPQVGGPMGLVVAAATAHRLIRARRFGPLAAATVCGSGWLLLIGLYNRALAGSWLTLPWSLFRPAEHYGFGQPLQGNPFIHTPWTAAENLLVSAVRFNGWWLGWPCSLALLLLWWRLGRPRRGATLWLAAGAALILFHVFYYSSGVSETGPVYYYELLLPASFLGGHAVVSARRRWASFTAALLLVHLGLGTGTFLLEKTARLRRMMQVVHEPVEAVVARIDPPALLIYETALQESLRLGWLNSGFPLRFRSDLDDIVTYPRSYAFAARGLRRHYSERSCWHYRVNPQTWRQEINRCAAVEELFDRPVRLEGPALAVPSTAMRRGLLDPFHRDKH